MTRTKDTNRGKTSVRNTGAKKAAKNGEISVDEEVMKDTAEMQRCREDFEYWARRCVMIKDKTSGRMVPFVLNSPQRRVLAIMEEDRKAGRPVRLIMLKARQWGGSTLVQMYMAWIQCTRRTYWNSLICAQVGKTAATIRGMYERMLANYPEELWDADCRPALLRFQSQDLVREIAGRHCNVTLGSSESQDAVRGADYAMAHLSEVAFWKDTPKSSPADFIRAISGAIALMPDSVVVLESTANGVGNYFHSEWLRSVRGETDKRAVFVPWYEIEIYRAELPHDIKTNFRDGLDDYEQYLANELHLSDEQIYWYRLKRREYAQHRQMMAEYPTTAQEAFANTGCNVFSAESVEALRSHCREPLMRGEIISGTGQITGKRSLLSLGFVSDARGGLEVWATPEKRRRYVVAVDVGGRSAGADWSVITVLLAEGREVVAQWRGHTDHDILTWRAAAIATYYNKALLVFESNTLESGEGSAGSPDQGAYILHELYDHYPNLYHRYSPDGVGGRRPGFHTNRATKQMIITELVAAVRQGTLIERSAAAADEFAVYEQRPNGSYGARTGFHDDMLMTRAIALHVCLEEHSREMP